MALAARVGTLDVPAATGNQAVTGLGFAPRLVFFWCSPRTADGSSPNLSLGFGVSGVSGAVGALKSYGTTHFGADGATTNDYAGESGATQCVRLDGAGGADVVKAAMASLDADGFTLNWTVVTAGVDVHYLVLGGFGLVDVAVTGAILSPASSGEQAVTGVGFQPNLVFFLPSTGGTGLCVGAATADDSQWVVMATSTGATSDAKRWLRTDRCMGLFTGAGVLKDAARFVSMDADGCTVEWLGPSSSPDFYRVVAVRVPTVRLGTLAVPAAPGEQAVAGSVVAPFAALFFGIHGPASASASAMDDHHRLFVGGAARAGGRAVVATSNRDNVATHVSDHDSDTTKCVKAITEGTPTVDYAADVADWCEDCFILDWTVVGEGAGDAVPYVAFGGSPPAASGSFGADAPPAARGRWG